MRHHFRAIAAQSTGDAVVRCTSVRETSAHTQPRLLPWMPVFDATGIPIGQVSEPAQADGYLLVEKGFFFTKLVYVPLDAITHCDVFGVHLSLRKDALNSREYTTPLAGAAAIAG